MNMTLNSRLKHALVLLCGMSLLFANLTAYAADAGSGGVEPNMTCMDCGITTPPPPPPAQPATVTRYVITDRLGNPVAKTDSTGAVIWRQTYTPYGETAQQPDPDGPGFTGHRHDAATGLVYMQARYYDPKIGRFLSPDPVTFSPNQPQHFNRYWYGNGNPYKYTDPTGKDGWNFIFNPTMTLQQMQNYAQVSAARDRINAVANDPGLNYQTRQAFGNGAAGLLSAASIAFPLGAEVTEPLAIFASLATAADKSNHEGLDSNDILGLAVTALAPMAGGIAKATKAGNTTVKLIEMNSRATSVLSGAAGAASAVGKSSSDSSNNSGSSSGGLNIKGVRSADGQIKRCLHCTMDQQ